MTWMRSIKASPQRHNDAETTGSFDDDHNIVTTRERILGIGGNMRSHSETDVSVVFSTTLLPVTVILPSS